MRILALRADGFVLPSIHASLVKAFESLKIEVVDLSVPNSSDHFRSFVESTRGGVRPFLVWTWGQTIDSF
jgi:hypothetical protein